MRLNDFGLIALVVLVVLGGGASLFLTSKYDELTGTTLEQRCEMRESNIAALQAIAATRELSEAETTALAGYQAFVARFCSGTQVPEELPPPPPPAPLTAPSPEVG